MVIVLHLLISLVKRECIGFFSRLLLLVILEMILEILLPQMHGIFLLGSCKLYLLDNDVRGYPFRLNRPAAGGKVAGGCQPEPRIVRERNYSLDRTFSEALDTHDYCTLMILKRTGNDLGCAGTSAVYKYDDRIVGLLVTLARGKAHLGVLFTALGIHNELTLCKERL